MDLENKLKFTTKNQKQVDAINKWNDDVTEQILYGGAKGGGKSFLGISIIFAQALIYPETHFFIARKELNDLRKFTIPTIHEVFGKWDLKLDDWAKFNGQDNYYTLYNGSKVYLIACKSEPSDPLFERFGSMQMTQGMIEEAGEVEESAKENLWLSIGRWKNDVYGLKKKLLLTANPKKGWLKRQFVDPFFEKTLEITKAFIQAFAHDNKHLPQGYEQTLSDIKDPVARARLFEGRWDYDETKDSLITFDNLCDCFSNTIIKDGNKYMTVDVARLGVDSTVIGFWNGLELYKLEQFDKQATNITVQKIKDYASIEQIPYSHIIIDEDGIGGGVVDNLFGVKGFVANSTPLPTTTDIKTRESKIQHQFVPKTNFANLKSQCGWKLAELINEHKISFRVPEYRDKLTEELTALLRDKEVDGEAKKRLVPKDEVKKVIGRSPDVGDIIIFRAYFELMKIASTEDPHRNDIVETQTVKFVMKKNNLRSNK